MRQTPHIAAKVKQTAAIECSVSRWGRTLAAIAWRSRPVVGHSYSRRVIAFLDRGQLATRCAQPVRTLQRLVLSVSGSPPCCKRQTDKANGEQRERTWLRNCIAVHFE